MVDPINDIDRQARQGSVAAIIQILNERLADSGVRTRAMLADGVLQLLCEAAQPEQLDQPTLVERIRYILEAIQPRNIRRININSRIVREQQLLWLEEINRDPKGQLLWSQLITLRRKSPLKRLAEDWKANRIEASKTALPKSSFSKREQRQFWRGILGGAGLSVLLVILGWLALDRLSLRADEQTPISSEPTAVAVNPVSSPEPLPTTAPTQGDPFVQAVRIAEQAAADGQNAQSQAEWLDLATRWQRASDLMSQVAPGDQRFQTAQSRIGAYQQNSDMALRRAESLRSQPTSGTSSAVQSGSN